MNPRVIAKSRIQRRSEAGESAVIGVSVNRATPSSAGARHRRSPGGHRPTSARIPAIAALVTSRLLSSGRSTTVKGVPHTCRLFSPVSCALVLSLAAASRVHSRRRHLAPRAGHADAALRSRGRRHRRRDLRDGGHGQRRQAGPRRRTLRRHALVARRQPCRARGSTPRPLRQSATTSISLADSERRRTSRWRACTGSTCARGRGATRPRCRRRAAAMRRSCTAA